MVNFIWGAWLLGIALVPLALWWYAKNVTRPAEAVVYHPDAEFIASLKPASLSRQRDLPALLFVATLALSLVALARPIAPLPQLDNRTTVVIAVDVSGSMRNDDIKPSRFLAMQVAVRGFIKQLPSDLKLGLVSFAGTAALNVAPTFERRELLDAVDAMFMARGTAIGAGLRESIAALPARTVLETATKPLEVNPPPAIVVLLTDGRNNREPDPIQIARIAKTQQVKVYTIGLGTLESNQGGETYRGFDPKVLQDIAQITGGEYFAASSADQLGAVYTKLGSNLGWTFKPSEVTHVVATVAGLLLLSAMVFGERNRRVI